MPSWLVGSSAAERHQNGVGWGLGWYDLWVLVERARLRQEGPPEAEAQMMATCKGSSHDLPVSPPLWEMQKQAVPDERQGRRHAKTGMSFRNQLQQLLLRGSR